MGEETLKEEPWAIFPQTRNGIWRRSWSSLPFEGKSGNTVWTDLVLVRADSPEEAYQRALELGTAKEETYQNPEGTQVTVHFRGLRDLNVIHDELEHDAELIYSEDLDLDESAIQKLISPKEELGVFRPIAPRFGNDHGE